MHKIGVKLAIAALTGTIAFSGIDLVAYATEDTVKALPSAGIAVVLEEEAILRDITKVTNSVNTKETLTNTEAEQKSNQEQDFTGLVIAQVNNYVNVRSMPSEEGEIVGKLYDKSVGEFIEEENGWYKITSGKCTGYVKAEYCVTGEDAQELAKEVGTTYAVVNTTTLKVRKEPSTEATVLGLVPLEEELVVLEDVEGWVKVAIEEGDGYVSKDYVDLRTDFVHAESKEEEEARLAAEEKARQEAQAAARAAQEAAAAKAAAQAACLLYTSPSPRD